VPTYIKIALAAWYCGNVSSCGVLDRVIEPRQGMERGVFLPKFNDKTVYRDVEKKELIVALQPAKNHLYTGLPDGLFSNQKSQFGSILEFLR
jgi:hypothetical protein